MSELDQRQRLREERSRRAVTAAVGLAREHGIRVDDPHVLADNFSVMVHLRPAPVVARVSTWTAKVRTPIEEWLGREIAITSYLAEQGAPVVAPTAELPPGPYTRDGFGISFWTFIQRDGDRWASMAECEAALADLHAAMKTYPGELPVLAPAANDIPLGLALVESVEDVLGPGKGAVLRAAAERLQPFVDAPSGELQPLHGDVHPGNLIATRDGLVWIDFEDVCLGPVEWDYALLRMFDADIVKRQVFDPAALNLASDLRALHLAMCGILFRDVFGDRPDWDDDLRNMLGMLPAVP